jgi:hypothetical protein
MIRKGSVVSRGDRYNKDNSGEVLEVCGKYVMVQFTDDCYWEALDSLVAKPAAKKRAAKKSTKKIKKAKSRR